MAPQTYKKWHKRSYDPRPTLPAVMDSSQAVSILEGTWGRDPNVWRPHDFPFGANPLQWPPRIVTALAALATAAGPSRREMALQMVDRLGADERRAGRLSRTTSEHIHRVTEELKRIPESQKRGTNNPTPDSLTRSQTSTRIAETDNSVTHAPTTSRETASRGTPAHDIDPSTHCLKRALSPNLTASLDSKKLKLDNTAEEPRFQTHPPITSSEAAKPEQPSNTEPQATKPTANEPQDANPAANEPQGANPAANDDHDAATLRAQLAAAQHELTQTHQRLEALALDLSLTTAALSAAQEDASTWRAVKPGYRRCLAENMRLSRAESRAEEAEALVAGLKRKVRDGQIEYMQLEAEKVDVWGDGDAVLPGLVRERDRLRKEVKGLRTEVERMKKRGG